MEADRSVLAQLGESEIGVPVNQKNGLRGLLPIFLAIYAGTVIGLVVAGVTDGPVELLAWLLGMLAGWIFVGGLLILVNRHSR